MLLLDSIFFLRLVHLPLSSLFFFNDTATTEIYTLSLHDALPIYGEDRGRRAGRLQQRGQDLFLVQPPGEQATDRKSTRLNSSHQIISYAVFCLKKKKTNQNRR